METILIDDEGVRRTALEMRQAAEQMTRAANLIDESLRRFMLRFEDSVAALLRSVEEGKT